jgi:3-hydroxybutyryl-CoA dehydratase
MQKGDSFQFRYCVTPDIRDGFLALFGDRNPLHTDKAFAREKGFREEVMYGNILNGFISHFVGELLPVKNIIIHAQQIKYFKPFYCGDELTLKAELGEVIESVKAYIFTFSFSNQDNTEIAKGKVQIGMI